MDDTNDEGGYNLWLFRHLHAAVHPELNDAAQAQEEGQQEGQSEVVIGEEFELGLVDPALFAEAASMVAEQGEGLGVAQGQGQGVVGQSVGVGDGGMVDVPHEEQVLAEAPTVAASQQVSLTQGPDGQSEGQVYEEGLIGELVGAGDGGMLDVPYEEQVLEEGLSAIHQEQVGMEVMEGAAQGQGVFGYSDGVANEETFMPQQEHGLGEGLTVMGQQINSPQGPDGRSEGQVGYQSGVGDGASGSWEVDWTENEQVVRTAPVQFAAMAHGQAGFHGIPGLFLNQGPGNVGAFSQSSLQQEGTAQLNQSPPQAGGVSETPSHSYVFPHNQQTVPALAEEAFETPIDPAITLNVTARAPTATMWSQDPVQFGAHRDTPGHRSEVTDAQNDARQHVDSGLGSGLPVQDGAYPPLAEPVLGDDDVEMQSEPAQVVSEVPTSEIHHAQTGHQEVLQGQAGALVANNAIVQSTSHVPSSHQMPQSGLTEEEMQMLLVLEEQAHAAFAAAGEQVPTRGQARNPEQGNSDAQPQDRQENRPAKRMNTAQAQSAKGQGPQQQSFGVHPSFSAPNNLHPSPQGPSLDHRSQVRTQPFATQQAVLAAGPVNQPGVWQNSWQWSSNSSMGHAFGGPSPAAISRTFPAVQNYHTHFHQPAPQIYRANPGPVQPRNSTTGTAIYTEPALPNAPAAVAPPPQNFMYQLDEVTKNSIQSRNDSWPCRRGTFTTVARANAAAKEILIEYYTGVLPDNFIQRWEALAVGGIRYDGFGCLVMSTYPKEVMEMSAASGKKWLRLHVTRIEPDKIVPKEAVNQVSGKKQSYVYRPAPQPKKPKLG